MIAKLKLYAYAVLAILAIWFGVGFYSNYTAVTRKTDNPPAETNSTVSAPPTNVVDTTTVTNATNAPGVATNQTAATTNETSSVTNAAATNTNPPAVAVTISNAPPATPAAPRKGSQGAMIGYLAAFIGVIVGLGLLIANDVTQYMGSRTVDMLFDADGEAERDPEYEKAEQVWANGKPLEAIQMMRDYLKENPREQYVALRIAEIYEKDLRNYVAAALEYEEVLKKKLEAERWGWAAIHLCNLYSKMNQQEKTVALLERIVAEQPQTGAAKKAREKLGLPELVVVETPVQTKQEEAPPPEPETPKSNLPPGFRPK